MMKIVAALLLVVASLSATGMAAENCAAGGEDSGFRVHHYVSDPTLHAAWAVLVDCLHPASPGKVIPVAVGELLQRNAFGNDLQKPPFKAPVVKPFVVQTGSAVRLWMASGSTQMNLEAVAMASGALGANIPVRLIAGSRGVLHGTVRGPGSVELAAPSADLTWRKEP